MVGGFFVQTKDSTGTRNVLDLSSATSLTKVALDALVANDDKTKRWYPVFFNSAKAPKTESTKFTAEDGTIFIVQKGIRSFALKKYAADPVTLKSVDVLECSGNTEWSFFPFTECAKIITEEVDKKIGRPLGVTNNTLDGTFQFADDDNEVSYTMIEFSVDKFVKDSRLKPAAVDDDADLFNIQGLLTARMVYSAISVTGATATATLDYGELGNDDAYEAAVTADWDANEITPVPGPVAAFAIVEGLAGIYAMTWTAETAADVLEFTSLQAGLDKGFEIEANSQLTIV